MTPDEFLPPVEWELHLHGVAFDRAELRAWLASCWPHVTEDRDAHRWAAEFTGQAAKCGRPM